MSGIWCCGWTGDKKSNGVVEKFSAPRKLILSARNVNNGMEIIINVRTVKVQALTPHFSELL